MTKLERAIASMREARQSHVDWAEWLEANPEEAAIQSSRPLQADVGDAAHQREWVAKYDEVLAILERKA